MAREARADDTGREGCASDIYAVVVASDANEE
jgi:hypothetical protein